MVYKHGQALQYGQLLERPTMAFLVLTSDATEPFVIPSLSPTSRTGSVSEPLPPRLLSPAPGVAAI
ncbi:FACR178Cp [Eremothecium gossypii FDAG1]|nr:FACR178Cp [Eremothecium gossypii FDAG1]